MKKLLLSLTIVSAAFAANAQELAPDQNPNYKVSLEKYKALQPAVTTSTATMNTTVQETYKAYDWRTARSERRAENRSYRREAALYDRYYGYDNYNGYNNYNGYYQPYRNNNFNYYYSPYGGYRNNYRRWRW